jgi:L-alanine-DL-glutamate epimerase-like enolase superfamily enzyme
MLPGLTGWLSLSLRGKLMIIKKLDFEDHLFQFKDGDYVMSHVTQKDLAVRVLRLESVDGRVGWGEVVRKPTLDRETVAPREEPLLKSLVGREVADLPAIARQYASRDKTLRGLAFGLETAFLDLVARHSGLPLYALLGGQLENSVAEYYSLSCGDVESVAPTLEREAKDWQVVQIKLGSGDRTADCERIDAALQVLAVNQTIMADFNGALNVESAVALIGEFNDARIIWEEPCNNIEDNTLVARRCGQPVMFDQCLESLDHFAQTVADGVAHSVCLKAPALGGIEVARAARELCISAGLPVRVDGPWCGHIATSVCLHLAVGVPSELLIAGCDLRQPLLLNDDWGGTKHLPRHRITPSAGLGHGAAPT